MGLAGCAVIVLFIHTRWHRHLLAVPRVKVAATAASAATAAATVAAAVKPVINVAVTCTDLPSHVAAASAFKSPNMDAAPSAAVTAAAAAASELPDKIAVAADPHTQSSLASSLTGEGCDISRGCSSSSEDTCESSSNNVAQDLRTTIHAIQPSSQAITNTPLNGALETLNVDVPSLPALLPDQDHFSFSSQTTPSQLGLPCKPSQAQVHPSLSSQTSQVPRHAQPHALDALPEEPGQVVELDVALVQVQAVERLPYRLKTHAEAPGTRVLDVEPKPESARRVAEVVSAAVAEKIAKEMEKLAETIRCEISPRQMCRSLQIVCGSRILYGTFK